MSSRKTQKLGSSRRFKNRNREIEEKESEEECPDPGHEKHDSEPSQFHTVSENQASNSSSLLHSDQPVIACTNPNISVFEHSPQPLSQDVKDLSAQADVTSKKRKMGSTRKGNRNFKFEEIFEDEPEHRVKLSEGVIDEQGVTVETSKQENMDKENQTSFLECAPSQSSEHESSILQGKHLALGTIVHNEDDHKNDEHQHLEASLENKHTGTSNSELNQSKEAESIQDLIHTSLEFSIITPTESHVPVQELDESLQIYHQMDTFSEPVASLPNPQDQKSSIDTAYTPINGDRERQDVQVSPKNLIHNDKPPAMDHTVHKPMDGQSSLNSLIKGKQEEKEEREDGDTLEFCSGEDIRQDEVTGVVSASLVNEHEHGAQIDKVTTVILQDVITKEATEEDENIVDHCLEPKSTEFGEDTDKYKEVSVAGDKTDNDSVEGVAATNLNQPMDPDRNIISPLQLNSQEVETSSNEFPSYKYREEQNSISAARCCAGESSADEDIAKKDVDMHYNEEETYRQIGTERKVANDDMQSTMSNQLIFSKVSLTNMLAFVTESELIPTETLYGETETRNQTGNHQHNLGEFPTELEQTKAGLCSIQMLDKVINDRSECLDIEIKGIEEEKNDIKEEINAGSKEDFTKVDDEKDGMSTIMTEHEMASVITDIQDYAFADQPSMVDEEHGNAYPTNDRMGLVPETQVKLDMQVNYPIAIADKKHNIAEECLLNQTNRESEAEQFERTSPTLYVEESRLGQDDAVAENVRFSPSEKNEADSTQRSLSGLISEGDQKEEKEAKKETILVQSLEESKPITNDGPVSFTPETCHLQPSESLNIMEPEGEKIDENIIKAVVKNENRHTSKEYNETPQHMSTEIVSTNQGCGVLARKDEEAVMVKNICGEVETTHVVLSDVIEHLVDTEVLKMQSRTEVAECIVPNEQIIWEGDKDGQSMSLDNPHQNTCTDLKLGHSKALECTQIVTVTIRNDCPMTSAEPMGVAEVAQLPEANIQQASTTSHEEAHMLISTNSNRRKMGSIRRKLRGKDKEEDMYGEENVASTDRSMLLYTENELSKEKNNDEREDINIGATKKFTMEDLAKDSQQYMYSEISAQSFSSSQSTIEHPSPVTEHSHFKEDGGNSIERKEETDAKLHAQTQTKKKKKYGSTRKLYGRYQRHGEREEGEWKENTEEIEDEIITQTATSNLLSEIQNTMSEASLDIHDSQVTVDDQTDEVSNAEGLNDITEQHEKLRVNEGKDAESIHLNNQEMAPIITKTQEDAFTEHVSLAGKKNGNEFTDHERASEVNVHSTSGPVERIPETQAMSDMQIIIDNILTVVSDQNQNISEEHLENPMNRESEPEQLESTSPLQIQESKPSLVEVMKENVEFNSSEKRRKTGKAKENIQEENMDEIIANTVVIEEENNDTKEEINVDDTENLIQEDITIVGSQQEVSSQTTDLALPTVEHPSPATEHPDFKEHDRNSIETMEKTNAEIHTQTQTKKKKKFGSTRKPHGRHQPHVKGEEGEWRDPENTEEIEHHFISQAATSSLLTEIQNTMSEISLDIHESHLTTKEKQIIKSEVEVVTGGISAPTTILEEDDQTQTVVADEVSNAEGLTDIIERHEKLRVNEGKDAESIQLNNQEMEPIITKTQEDAFTEHVYLAVTKDSNESPDHERASEVNVHSTSGPVERIPETQAMSDMQIIIDNILTVVSDQNQNISEEHLENPMKRESEPEQLESTSPLVQIQESKPYLVEVMKENVEFSSSEKKGKMSKAKENIQEENMDEIIANTVVIEEENNDAKEEINADDTENFTKEDITTVSSQQYILCELSSQTTDLALPTVEHPSPATEHPDFKEHDGNSIETMEKTNAEIHTQTQTKKKKKFGSTRKPHGRHQPHVEGEEGEWRDPENTEEIEHQFITQAATSSLLTEIQNTMSEVSLDIHDSHVITEEKQIIKLAAGVVAEGISASSTILSKDDDQIETVLSEEVSNAEGLTDIIEHHEKPSLNEQEMAPIVTKTEDDAFIEHVCLTVKKNGNEFTDHESASEVKVHSTSGPVGLIPETQAMSDMQIIIDNILTVVSDQNQNISEEHLENPKNRESEPEQLESTSPLVQIQESKPSLVEVMKENVEFSSSEKRRKMGKAKENIQGENMDEIISNTVVIEEENNDTKEEIIVDDTENLIKENITTVGSQQELSSQTTDLALPTVEHPSPATEHPDFKEHDRNSIETMEKTNAEIHTQTQTKKKKKFGSTRKPHGRHQPHVDGEEGEWRDPENTEEIEHQIITQAATSSLLTEIQNTMSEISLDIHESHLTTKEKQIIKSEVEVVTGGISAPTTILEKDDQTQTVVADEVSNAEGLTDIIEHHEKLRVNEGKNAESINLNNQEMAPIITKTQEDAFTEHVSLAGKNNGNESPDHERASEVNVHSTSGPVELIPETQAMSDMQIIIDNILTVVSDQNQNISEEHLENPMNRESEPEQLESTSPLVQIQESKPYLVEVMKENVEFSSSEKRGKMSKAKENIQEENMDEIIPNTVVIEEENNDTKEEINVDDTENLIKENITTVGSQQEVSSQTTDLALPTVEHPSPATEHPDFKEHDGNSIETMEKTNAEIHTQTQTKKKKKFGSTRKPHGRHQPHVEGEEGEWRDPENTEEIEHQFITQAATSSLLTEIQNTMSEISLDIHESHLTTKEKQIIKSEVEVVTGEISAPTTILEKDDQTQTVVADEVNNAEGLTDIIEHHEKLRVNEGKDAESIQLNNQEMAPIITKTQEDAFTEHVYLAVTKDSNESPDHERASEVNVHSTSGPVELIPETQAMSDMQIIIDNILTVVSDQNQNISEEHLENPMNRESEPEQLESTSPLVQIQESKPSLVEVMKENVEFSSSEKRRKMSKAKENIQEENMDETIDNTVVIEEENNYTKEEINVDDTENYTKEDITTVGSQQEVSSQTTDLALPTVKHPSPATEHPDFKEHDRNSIETMEKTNAEIHTQTQTKKKKKFGSTRKPHGRHQPHVDGEEGEWRNPENTEEIEHQFITQAATSSLLSEIQNTMSEVSLDIHDSHVITEEKQIIKLAAEVVAEGISATSTILSKDDQTQTVVADDVSNAEGLTKIIEQHEKPSLNEETDAESTLLNEQEMAPIITKTEDDAFIEHVSLAVTKDSNESPDHESASEVNAHSTSGPVELIPETQAMSDMQIIIDNILTVVSDQSQNISEEHLENPMNRESEPEQLESTSPLQIQESKPYLVEVMKENVEFSSSEKKRKMGSTRKSLRGKITGSDQKNKFEEIKAKENIQEENMNQISTNTVVIEEENNDTKEQIYADDTENFTKQDITTVGSQQYMLCELSSQTTDLGLTTIEHPSPATEHPHFKERDGNSIETMEKTNAEIHTQSQTKKKKKFGSTRKPHGRHQPHVEGEEGEWRDFENIEETEDQIKTQATTSSLLTEIQNTMSEVSFDIHDSQVTVEQKEIVKSEVEVMTGGISAPPSILSKDHQTQTVVSDEVSNEGLTDVIEHHEKPKVNAETDAESVILKEQEMPQILTKTQDDAFSEHVSLAVIMDVNESPDHESASDVNVHSTYGPVKLIHETQAMSDMQMSTENILTVVSDQNQYVSEEHLENPTNKESKLQQLESTSPFVQIQESKPSPVVVVKENAELSSSEKKRKIGKAKENLQEENMDQISAIAGAIKKENSDTKEEINAGDTENFTKQDITTVGSQQYMLCELSSQTTDLALPTVEHPSPATEHPDFKEHDGSSIETMEKTNAEIHTQSQTKKKKKFGSTRKPHGRHQPHAEGEEGERRDFENIEETEDQIITQAGTLSLLTEIQNTMSEVSLDVHDSHVTTKEKQIIKSEVELATGGISAPTTILSKEDDQTQTVVSDEVSNSEGLTHIIEHHEKPRKNEDMDGDSTLLNEQEMAPIVTKTEDDAFIKHVSLAVKKDGNKSPDHESASEVNAQSTCGTVELIPETETLSNMQIIIDNIHTVVSNQSQNISEEHLENPMNRDSEPEQLESTSPLVQIQESKPSSVVVIKENVEFSSSEKRRKMGSTRKSLRGKITESDLKNKFEEIKAKENTQEEDMDQISTNTVVIKENNNDTKEKINADATENFSKENITTVGSQQYMLCELSSQTTDLGLHTVEHPSPATEHTDFKEHDGNRIETTEKTNAEIHTQTQTKKKKKLGSTRKPHGRHQPHVEGEEGEWRDPENTEEIEHQIITQPATSSLLTELHNAVSEASLDVLEPSLRTNQGMECTDHESANQLAYLSTGSVELIPETQSSLGMPVLSKQHHLIFEEHLENPKNRELEPEQCESSCPAVHIQELNLPPDDMAAQSSEHSNSGRRNLRVIKEKENIQEQTTSAKDHAKKEILNSSSEVSHQPIHTHSESLNIIEPKGENMGLPCKNLEDGQRKQEAWQKTKGMNPRYARDIDREDLKLVAKDDMVMPDSNVCDTGTRVQEYEPQVHNNLDQSEGSLLKEIEFYMNKSLESPLNTTALSPNISKFSEPVSEGSLQLPSSQNPQIHMEMSSPTRKRKMGSSRKPARNKRAEKISNESSGSEQEKENLDKNNAKSSEQKHKIETKTVKETALAEGTESVELMSEVQVLSQTNESSIQDPGQLLPEGRRKLGSRRTAKGNSRLSAFTHGDYESNQKKTEVQVTNDDLRVSDPYFISEPESTPISPPVSELRLDIEDTNVSTESSLVSLDNIKKTLPCTESTRGRPIIDFGQWNEQLPDFGQAVYNVVMVGNSNVGKTSFIKRLQSGRFIPDYNATIGVDTFVQTVTFGNRTVKLYVWDTAGQERYHSITRQVFHKAQGLLLMYDITSSQSFCAVRAWISQIQENAPPDVTMLLLGNKNDCAHREVQLQEGEDLSKEYDIHFMECSAATGENVSESLKTLAWLLVKQRVRKEEEHTTLQPKPQNKKSGCC